MSAPAVSVICLCYNHARFVGDAIRSVLDQTHPNVQLIVVDDASTDNSAEIIREILAPFPGVVFLSLEKNLGNCRAFNRGLALANGAFIIDLAADDILNPTRISEGVAALTAAGPAYGVNYSDAEMISENGEHLGFHSAKFSRDAPPQGDVYKDVIGKYFINSPSMMFRREVMDTLNGYDETLAYEDFDFWVRSARQFFYCFSPEPLIKRRIVGNSMARQQYKRNSPQLFSTFRVCEKIKAMNRNAEEDKVLRKRIRYEARKSFAVGEFRLVVRYLRLYISIQ